MTTITLGKNKLRRLPKSYNLYLGVDGGGTKTHAVLIDEKRDFVGEAFSGASNPLRVGIEKAAENILAAVDAACDAADRNRGDVVSAEIGLAGVRREDLRQRVRERIVQRLAVRNVTVVTDAEIALYGATDGKAGMVIIAGTGSICCGRNDRGDIATAGGWGPLAGDEGGGAGIARRALQAIAKGSDGRAKQTLLSSAAIEYFRAGKLEDLSVAIYAPSVDNQKIAGFARLVIDIARQGDAVAIEVVAEAGRELGLSARAVIEKLKMERRKFSVSFVGSIFRAGELISAPLLEIVHAIAPKAYLSEPIMLPAHAAARMAFAAYGKNGKR